ncbi:MAG: hypothetical protein SZ59_C0002G0376 [candidate division TM6 bacterium GW2011_GWF2_28_16]|nr:MAG: hypothetical protein SZ59_C0002G0376 [candidate division TM6 bacterium GW2011_GWF2_28_16]
MKKMNIFTKIMLIFAILVNILSFDLNASIRRRLNARREQSVVNGPMDRFVIRRVRVVEQQVQEQQVLEINFDLFREQLVATNLNQEIVNLIIERIRDYNSENLNEILDLSGLFITDARLQIIIPFLAQRNVRKLNLAGNQIRLIPQNIRELVNLNYLNLNNNNIVYFNASFRDFIQGENSLEVLSKMQNLRIILLQNNNLDYIPYRFLGMRNLEVLNASDNRLNIGTQRFRNDNRFILD